MSKNKNNRLGVLLGAAFLMATSSIGPGFLTQTTVFTEQLLENFGFVILAATIIDIGAQLNIWRIIGVTGLRGQEIANKVLPGLGVFISILIVIGGLAFNIGNIAGAGLGLQVLLGISPETGALISAAIAISIFLSKQAGQLMDKFTQIMGALMVLLTIYVAFASNPPFAEAVIRTVAPTKIDVNAILTIVGGTVGGYITFSGGHRLLDAGIQGEENVKEITQSAVSGIGISTIMRVVLFLAALGVITAGHTLNPDNPAASVFQFAAGDFGYRIFGLVMWSAAVSSVIGAAYTSVSFLSSFGDFFVEHRNKIIMAFIVISATAFFTIGQPAQVLVIVGTLNGLILPIILGAMLLSLRKKELFGAYKHPLWLAIFGWIVFALTAYMSITTIINFFN